MSLHLVPSPALTGNYSQTVILDCCHSGAFVGKGYEYAASASHVLLASCSGGEVAKEANGRGYFTRALTTLLRSLGDGMNTVTYKDVIKLLNIPYAPSLMPCNKCLYVLTLSRKISNTSV